MASTLIKQSTSNFGKINPLKSVLMVCDVQERFRNLIYHMPTVIETSRHLIAACRELNVPCIVTEQNQRVFLSTVEELKIGANKSHQAIPVFHKQQFSMFTPEVKSHLMKLNEGKKDTVVICGIEAHVCVLQTCLDLLEEGFNVHVVADGISSQRQLDRSIAIRRLQQVGAYITTSESLIFQLLGSADHPKFKLVSALVKEHNKSEHQGFANIDL
mmetsp:Transcript_7829/g.11819  ORF Transcript_7829/g.11819 Transcript_7829/m.11819 type:complete len:215 (-) Transcript_7829:56-700(-)|eukprot:CAMPEP_0171455180 /NCGR_PEP_ID=MMETSP0945-20130129/2178_1 /TAXON_ID=109269 /ORGANISM="Vaucheria litorea, Strain CCMP2940" /LENGTH=214 /DNA_ID=CAMNT_0011980369 /DNA_START=26 /DNA_END=670 /DNA_ORIENTATION=-